MKVYAAVGRKEGVISQGCWAHARRKFDEAIKGQKDKNKTGKSHMGLSYIRKLYQIEHGIKDSLPDKRKKGTARAKSAGSTKATTMAG